MHRTPPPHPAEQGRAPLDLSPGESRAHSSVSDHSETQRREQFASPATPLFANVSQRSRALGKSPIHFGYDEATDPLASEPPTQDNQELFRQMREQIVNLERQLQSTQMQQSIEREATQAHLRPSQVQFDHTTANDPQAARSDPQQASRQPQRFSTAESIGSRSQSYLPKVTNMTNKLSDGQQFRASLWRAIITDRMEAYTETLSSQGLKRQYVLDQLEGTALDYAEGLYLQQSPRLSAESIVSQVADFLTDPAERERARDQFRVLRMQEGTPFREFYREFCLLASLARKTNAEDLRDDLATKVTPFYRRTCSMALLNSRSLSEDVRLYHHVDATEAGIKTIYGNHRSYDYGAPRKRQGATYSSSKQELAQQAKTIPADKPATTRTSASLPPNTPRHFTPNRTTYMQPAATTQGTTPFRPNTDRVRSQTSYAVNALNYAEGSEEEEAYSDAPEDQEPAVQAEAVAHAIYKEMDRAKGAA
jgi:hypothetical protein